jgi:hypothetical protein
VRRRAAVALLVLLTACAERFEEGREYRDADGARFTVARVPKVEGGWHRVDAHTIRVHPFRTYKVAREDDDAFLVKIYVAPDAAAAPPATTTTAAGEPVPAASARFAFVETGAGLPRRGQWRQAFDLADMDGDGHLDLVHGPRRKTIGPPIVLRGDGAGGFARWTDARFPRLPYDYGAVAVADFDRNGTNDVALAAHLRGLTVLAGDGAGTFTPMAAGLVLAPAGVPGADGRVSSRALALVDWTGDGVPEIVALADGPVRGGPPGHGRGMSVFSWTDGRWSPLPGPDAGDPVFGDAVAVGDLDGDGTREVVVATQVMAYARLVRRRTARGWESVELPGLRPDAFVDAIATGDFDRDGREEVVVAHLTAAGGVWRTGIDLHYGSGMRRALALDASRRRITALATGDLDGDGALDLVAVGGDGLVATFAGDGAGFVTRDAEIAVPAWRRGCGGTHVRVADLDGDGRGEIVAAFAGERAGLDRSPAAACTSGGGVEAWTVRRP